MFITGLKRCQFVVWKQGIFSVEVTDDPSFMSNVCAKLEKSPSLSPLLYKKKKKKKKKIIIIIIIIIIEVQNST